VDLLQVITIGLVVYGHWLLISLRRAWFALLTVVLALLVAVLMWVQRRCCASRTASAGPARGRRRCSRRACSSPCSGRQGWQSAA
jgi:uncharacterized iron-regulated membrane protein